MSINQLRYTISITPPPESSHWEAGCIWLGYDPVRRKTLQQPSVIGINSDRLWELTGTGRWRALQGFLKPPFRLAEKWSEEDVLAKLETFAREFPVFSLPGLQLVERDQRFCLEPTAYPVELISLAAKCVTVFDSMSAPLNLSESARLRARILSPQERDNLNLWGVPEVFSRYRMQIMLTSRITDPTEKEVIFSALSKFFSKQNNVPLIVDGISLYVETGTKKGPSRLLARFPLSRQIENSKEHTNNGQKPEQNVYS